MDIQSINIFKKGVHKSLGTLESAIMEILWKQAEPQSARQVTDAMAEKTDVSFNAVSTVLGRLEQKELVKRVAKGKRYSFAPTKSKQEYSYSIFAAGLQSLLGDKSLLSAAGISGNQGGEAVDPDTIAILSDFLEQHEA